MKHVVVIGSKNSGSKNDPAVIAANLSSGDVSVVQIYWEDLVFQIKTSSVEVLSNGQDILAHKPELFIALGWYKNGKDAIYRDVAYSLSLVLDSRGIDYWNSEMGHQRSTTKLSTMVQLALANIPVPTTDFSLTTTNILSAWHFPFIAKAVAASRGKNNFLVTDEAVLEQVKLSGEKFLIQNFIENDHDLRVICFNSKPSLVLRRARAKDSSTHLNNTSQGGSARWLALSDLSTSVLTLTERISTITRRELAGIDLIPDAASPVGYSCLEVNSIPQLTSGTDTEKKMATLAAVVDQL